MNTDLQACVEAICNFPTLCQTGHKTPIGVVRESGYEELFTSVTVDSIARHLSKQKNLIDTWIQFSEDIRHSPAWGFGRNKDNKWQVVYADNGNIIESFTFDNEVDACAKMIKETIERIRQHTN